MRRIRIGATMLALAAGTLLAGDAQAQMIPLALEVRGGFNFAIGDLKDGLGDINQDGIEVAQAEQAGWTGAADLYWTFHEKGAVYAGFSYAHFDCKEEECGSDGKLNSQGPALGFKFSLSPGRSFSPWARLGVIAHEAQYEEGDVVEEESNRALGLEAGLGTDIHLGETVAIVPAVRFYRYNPSWDVGSIGDERVNRNVGWFQADVGLQFNFGN